MGTKLLGYVFVAVAVVLFATALYLNTRQSQVPLVFSPQQMLNSTWNSYKLEYLERGTSRTLDKQRDNVTTSEGQSYTMLRAVWMGDKDTFDASWKWTKDNLQHEEGDRLFSWLFGKRADGTYGVLTDRGGETSASDADTDIALALIFAYARWQDVQYLGDAREIIRDIWEKEVVTVKGTPYMAADNLETATSTTAAAINPSYLHPAAYRIFALVDPEHQWNSLALSSYTLLEKSVNDPLDKEKTAKLVPDWIQMDKKTGELRALPAPTGETHTTNFSFDALRTPLRIALDWKWFGEPRAKQFLSELSFLSSQWRSNRYLATSYAHDGRVVSRAETPAMYGGTIGYFTIADPELAPQVYENKLQFLYDPGRNGWKDTLSYYDDNMAWFGIALYNDLLPNLSADLPASAFSQ